MNCDYIDHYKQINNIEDIEASYKGAKTYYEAELTQIFPYINKRLPIKEKKYLKPSSLLSNLALQDLSILFLIPLLRLAFPMHPLL